MVMIEPRHLNAQKEFAVSRRSNSGHRREKVLTTSCRPDSFQKEALRLLGRRAFLLHFPRLPYFIASRHPQHHTQVLTSSNR